MNQFSTLYKRELKILLCSVSGWAFVAINLFSIGIFSAFMNVRNGYVNYEYALEAASLLFCVSIPVLCSLHFAGEIKRGETDMLMRYASPIGLMMSKYLAWLTLFSVSAVAAAALPPVLCLFGSLDLAVSYLGVMGYVLVGAALIAVGMYIALAAGRTGVSLVSSFVVIAALAYCADIAQTWGMYNTMPYTVVALVLIILITVALYFYLKSMIAPIVFVISSSLFLAFGLELAPYVLRKLFVVISPYYSFTEMIYGTFSPWGVIQPILFIAAFLLLSFLRLNGRREVKR